jgi:hypothetical protein
MMKQLPAGHPMLKLTNSSSVAITVSIEPWAHEYTVPSGGSCEIAYTSPDAAQDFDVALAEPRTTVWVNRGDLLSVMLDGIEVLRSA